MHKILFLIVLLSGVFFFSPIKGEAKKIGFRFPAKESKEEKKEKLTAGSFKIDLSSETEGDYADKIIFSGFDKKLNSSSESFFITNNTDRVLTEVEVSIEYLTPDGRQLHKSFHEVKCDIPAGETRKIDIKSWDSQHSFYYVKSAPSRGTGSPFIVRFSPVACYLRY